MSLFCLVFPVASLFVECSDCSQSDKSDNSYTLSLQSSVNITCNNTASTDLDSLEFTWKKDNLPLSEDEYHITHISQGASALMFEIANFTDAGVYKCVIGNSIGSSNKIVHINVLCECCNLSCIHQAYYIIMYMYMWCKWFLLQV